MPLSARSVSLRAAPRRAREALRRIARKASRPASRPEREMVAAIADAQMRGHVANARTFADAAGLRARIEVEVTAESYRRVLAALADEGTGP